jgi:hypothetical protein
MSFKSFWKSSGEKKKSDEPISAEAPKSSPTADPKKDAVGPESKPTPKA